MKLCPLCRASYEDDTLNYCLNDGTPLIKESSQQDPQATLVLPAFQDEPKSQTQPSNIYAQTTQQPPGAATTSQTVPAAESRRSLTPWIIGGILLLAGIGIGLVTAFTLSGTGNNQSATSNNSSVGSNSGGNQNSNNNQTQSNTSSGQPYAAFADRTGRYNGKGLNTTHNVRGTIRLDITTINPDSGYVSSMMTSGGDLCGDAPLTGKITEDGKMNLSGTVTCKATKYAGPMTVRCQFTTTDTLTCTYTITNPKGYTPATQQGNFRITKQ